MERPIRRSPMSQAIYRDGAIHVESMVENVECMVWKGPVGRPNQHGVPTAYTTGFVMDERNGLEAYVIPRNVVASHGLLMSYGFWGARPKDDQGVSQAIPQESFLTSDDQENLGPDYRPQDLSRRRLELMKVISEYVVRVRILGLDPDTITLPRAEEWDVLAVGLYPRNVRFGFLIPRPDPTGQRWQTSTGNVNPEVYHEGVRKVEEGPKPEATPVRAAVEAVKAQGNLQQAVAGDVDGSGGLPAEGTVHRKGTLAVQQLFVRDEGEKDPAACSEDGG